MKLVKLISMVGLVLSISACKNINIENGNLPDEYVVLAQKYMGRYSGEFDGTPGTITLSLNGNRVQVDYLSAKGTDILDPLCESKIGNLTEIAVSGNKEQPILDHAQFSFDANKCRESVEGKMFHLYFSNKEGLRLMQVEILKYNNLDCPIGDPDFCSPRPIPPFMRGSFEKIP